MRSKTDIMVEIAKLYECPFCKVQMKTYNFDSMDCDKCGKKYRLDIEQLSYLQGYRQCLNDAVHAISETKQNGGKYIWLMKK